MSLLTPVKVPVKVYRWDDVGAPELDKTPNCLATIFKACLVTGYGTKEPAGWTMAFEDASAGVKVLRPEVSPHTDFYLRLSADTGSQMDAKVYQNMTDINTGDLKLHYDRPFQYAKGVSTERWMLIASSRGVVFCSEQTHTSKAELVNESGGFLYLGDVISKSGLRCLYLQYTSGFYDDGHYPSLLAWLVGKYDTRDILYFQPKMLTIDGTVVPTMPISIAGFNGATTKLNNRVLAPIVFDNAAGLFYLPGVYTASDGKKKVNFDELDISDGSSVLNMIVFGTGIGESNFYFATDYWV